MLSTGFLASCCRVLSSALCTCCTAEPAETALPAGRAGCRSTAFSKFWGKKNPTKCAIERLLILNSNQNFCLCDNKPLQRRFFLFPFLFGPPKFHEFLQGVKIRLTYFPANTALCRLRLSPPPGSPGLTSRPRYSPAPRPFPDGRFG